MQEVSIKTRRLKHLTAHARSFKLFPCQIAVEEILSLLLGLASRPLMHGAYFGTHVSLTTCTLIDWQQRRAPDSMGKLLHCLLWAHYTKTRLRILNVPGVVGQVM